MAYKSGVPLSILAKGEGRILLKQLSGCKKEKRVPILASSCGMQFDTSVHLGRFVTVDPKEASNGWSTENTFILRCSLLDILPSGKQVSWSPEHISPFRFSRWPRLLWNANEGTGENRRTCLLKRFSFFIFLLVPGEKSLYRTWDCTARLQLIT